MDLILVFPRQKLEPFLHEIHNVTSQTNVLKSDHFTYFLITFYIFIFVCGIFGNTWAGSVIISLIRNRSREPPRNIQLFILMLCIIDIFVLTFIPLTIDDMVNGQWTIFTQSSFVCKFYLCSELSSKILAPFILMALSGTCYMIVCKRQCRNFADDLRLGITLIVLALAILIVLISLVYLYGDFYYLVVYENSMNSNETSKIKGLALKCIFQSNQDANPKHNGVSDHVLYTFLIGYASPATSFTLFYFLIWKFVKNQSTWRTRSLVKSWRVARTVLGLISFFLFCWTPYWIMIFYSNLKPQLKIGDRNPITMAIAYITHILPYINCLGYPIIYIVLNRKIKENYEMIRKNRRSQLLELCGFRKPRSSKHRSRDRETRMVNHPINMDCTPIDQSSDTKCPDTTSITLTTQNRSPNSSIDSANGSSGLANVTELMEISRNLLIPLIQIDNAECKESEGDALLNKTESDLDVKI